MFVVPPSSDHRGFRRYRTLLLLLLIWICSHLMTKYRSQNKNTDFLMILSWLCRYNRNTIMLRRTYLCPPQPKPISENLNLKPDEVSGIVSDTKLIVMLLSELTSVVYSVPQYTPPSSPRAGAVLSMPLYIYKYNNNNKAGIYMAHSVPQ